MWRRNHVAFAAAEGNVVADAGRIAERRAHTDAERRSECWSRKPNGHPDSYISPKTQSIQLAVTAINGAAPSSPIYTIANTTGSGSTCTTSAGALTCAIGVAAPVGSDTFSARLYAQAGGAGQPISIGTSTVAIAAGAAINLSMNFLPVVSYVVASVTPADSFAIDAPATFTLNVTAEDVTLAPIAGSDPYYSPIVIASTDTGGHVTATPALPATLTAPGQSVTFAYDGKGTAASYVFNYFVKGDGVSGQVLPTDVPISFTSAVQHLYVSTDGALNVYAIASDGTLSGPVRSLSGTATGFTTPGSLYVDKYGALYVITANGVEVFAAGANGNVAPMETLAQSIHPSFVAGNGDRGFVVVGQSQGVQTAVFGTIYPSALPNGALLSGGSALYYPNLNSFAVSPVQTTTGPAVACGGTYEGPEQGESYVACFPGNPIYVNASGYPISSYEDFGGDPVMVAFRPDGKLIVVQNASSAGGFSVSTYTIPGTVPSGPGYVLTDAPTYQLQPGATSIAYPKSVALDSLGNLYIANQGLSSGSSRILVFPMNATGNVAPTRTLGYFSNLYGMAVGP